MNKASQVGTVALGLGVLAGCSEGGEVEVGTQSQAVEEEEEEEDDSHGALEIDLSVDENRIRMLENRAQRHGWTYEEAEMDQEATEAVGDAATRLERTRPGTLVGSVVPDTPGEHPLLYIKGAADALVQAIVAESHVPIQVVENQPYSLAELLDRKNSVHSAIREQGYSQLSTWFDFRNPEEIRVKVGRVPGGELAEVDALYDMVPEAVRDSTYIRVVDRKIVERQWASGGMFIRDGNTPVCTTGWPMEYDWGIFLGGWAPVGLTTAHHCTLFFGYDLDSVRHPGVTAHDSAFAVGYDSDWGDVEVHWVDATTLPKFYISNSTTTTVTGVEPYTSFSYGEEVCMYSRVQDGADCADIESLFVACDQALYQIQMDALITVGGDSGGSWYQQNTAFGSHVGKCELEDDWSDFTPADFFDEALGSDYRVYVD